MHSRFTFFTFVLFLLVFLGGVFYIKPLWDEVQTLNSSVAQQQDKNEQLTTQLQNLQNLQQALGSASEVSQKTALNAIPERLEQDRILADLSEIAEQNQVIINSYNFNIAQNSVDKVKKATLNVNLSSEEDELLGFLKGVENNERKLLVKTVSVQAGRIADSSTPRVNFNLSMEAYYWGGI